MLRGTSRPRRRSHERLKVAALLTLVSAAGCGPKRDADPGHPPPFQPAGPRVTVRISTAPEQRLLLPGRVEVLEDRGGDVPSGPASDASAADPSAVSAPRLIEGGPLPLAAHAAGGRVILGDIAFAGPIELRPAAPSPEAAAQAVQVGPGGLALGLEDLAPGGKARRRFFRGSLLLSIAGASITATNRLSLEEYLAGVVGAEMPASSYPMEALKAQAVASRTYALFALLRAAASGRRTVFAPDPTFQVYGGIAREHRRVREAVNATTGEVLFLQGSLFRAYFHSTCGGRTADASRVFGEPAIESLAGVSCGACDGSAFARWQARLPALEIERALRPWAGARGVAIEGVGDLEVAERTADDRVSYIRVRHRGGSFEIHVEPLRSLLDPRAEGIIKSSAFTVARDGEVFLFEGRGYGHGAGMCQVGAAMKAATRSYREVLEDYYPGSTVEAVY